MIAKVLESLRVALLGVAVGQTFQALKRHIHLPGGKLHAGGFQVGLARSGRQRLGVDEQYRVIFTFSNGEANRVRIIDYH